MRIGLGHDTHRLDAGYPLIVGGVTIPHDVGCVAHSDGDVLLHSLIDALLGALAWGDIGEWFPDTDSQYQGADSAKLLDVVMHKVREAGWRIENVDSVLFAQRPKFSPYKEPIRARVADLLGIEVSQVSVKAKTGEKVGPIGRGEAISAEVIVLLSRTSW